MAWLRGIIFLVTLFQFQTCQGNSTPFGACSNTVMVLTKEEMKREIRAQVAEALATSSQQQRGNCTCGANSIELLNLDVHIQELGHNLSAKLDGLLLPIMSKLITLHQPGMTASHPAISCVEVLDFNPNTPSGYYWLEASDGSAVRVYCDMTVTCKGVGGGWMQVAKLDMTNSSHQSPSGTTLRTDLPRHLCGRGIDGPGCSSSMFDIHGIKYNQVCGKIIAYQDESPDAFRGQQQSIDQAYVDGISLTHRRNPRKHIWTFAAALDEVGTNPTLNCPCTNVHQTSPEPPSFIGNDYFCDTASAHHYQQIFYGMELVVDQPSPAALSTTLHGSTNNCLLKNLITLK